MTTEINNSVRAYLAQYYSRPGQHIVDPHGDIRLNNDGTVEVFGVMPNTNYIDWFDAGCLEELDDMAAESRREIENLLIEVAESLEYMPAYSYVSQWLDAAYNPELDGDIRLANADKGDIVNEFREWLEQ